jgi:hypothetical protein
VGWGRRGHSCGKGVTASANKGYSKACGVWTYRPVSSVGTVPCTLTSTPDTSWLIGSHKPDK